MVDSDRHENVSFRSIRSQFDSICDEFDGQRAAGQRPDLADVLAKVEESSRPALAMLLIEIDVEYRCRDGEQPAVDDYDDLTAQDQQDHVQKIIDQIVGNQPAGNERTVATKDGTKDGVADQPTQMPNRSGKPASNRRPKSMPDLDDYTLIEEIARGGMGVVYKARQKSLNRTVALKMILTGQLAGEEEISRFRSEAEAAAKLDHQGIVPIYEIGEHEGHQFFSMGFVEGQSLAARIADGPLPAKEAAELVKKIADAIAFAHQAGVIHRDLKPANVLIDSNGEPRVTDFGLAKKIEDDSGLTGTGQILGTPGFMPPEQASGETATIDERADVYALGAILYNLTTGRPPFQAANPVETLVQVLSEEPIPPSKLNSQIPRDLETICLKCLEKEAAKRYDSATALADELQRFLSGESIAARPTGQIERTWRWCKRKPAKVTAIAVSVLLLLTLTIGGPIVAYNQTTLLNSSRNANVVAKRKEKEARNAEDNAKKQKEAADASARIARENLVSNYLNLGLGECLRDRIADGVGWYQKAFEESEPGTKLHTSSINLISGWLPLVPRRIVTSAPVHDVIDLGNDRICVLEQGDEDLNIGPACTIYDVKTNAILKKIPNVHSIRLSQNRSTVMLDTLLEENGSLKSCLQFLSTKNLQPVSEPIRTRYAFVSRDKKFVFADNILIGNKRAITVIDFDKGSIIGKSVSTDKIGSEYFALAPSSVCMIGENHIAVVGTSNANRWILRAASANVPLRGARDTLFIVNLQNGSVEKEKEFEFASLNSRSNTALVRFSGDGSKKRHFQVVSLPALESISDPLEMSFPANSDYFFQHWDSKKYYVCLGETDKDDEAMVVRELVKRENSSPANFKFSWDRDITNVSAVNANGTAYLFRQHSSGCDFARIFFAGNRPQSTPEPKLVSWDTVPNRMMGGAAIHPETGLLIWQSYDMKFLPPLPPGERIEDMRHPENGFPFEIETTAPMFGEAGRISDHMRFLLSEGTPNDTVSRLLGSPVKIHMDPGMPASSQITFDLPRLAIIVAFSKDQQFFCLAMPGGFLQIRSMSDGKLVREIELRGEINVVKGFREDSFLVGTSQIVAIVEPFRDESMSSNRPSTRSNDDGKKSLGSEGQVSCFATTPNNEISVVGCSSGSVLLLSKSMDVNSSLDFHAGPVTSCAISNTGRLMASSDEQGLVRLWDLTSGIGIGDPLYHSSSVTKIAISSDERWLFSGTSKGNVYAWDLKSRKLKTKFQVHVGGISALALAPNNRAIVSGDQTGEVNVFDCQIFEQMNDSPIMNRGSIDDIAFRPDGEEFAVSSDSGIRQYRLGSLKQSVRPIRTAEKTARLLFAADGSRILGASGSGTIQAWDAGTGFPIGRPLELNRTVVGLAGVGGSKHEFLIGFSDGVGSWKLSEMLDDSFPISGMVGVATGKKWTELDEFEPIDFQTWQNINKKIKEQKLPIRRTVAENLSDNVINNKIMSRGKASAITTDQNRIRQLMIAMHYFHDANKRLPQQFTKSLDGKPLLSWRVHILPYMEQNPLYDKFKLDEPWDSEHNIKLLDQMPKEFESMTIGNHVQKGRTIFLAPVNQETAIRNKHTTLETISDGTSRTIGIVMVKPKYAVPWTAPQDLPISTETNFVETLFNANADNGAGTTIIAMLDASIDAIPLTPMKSYYHHCTINDFYASQIRPSELPQPNMKIVMGGKAKQAAESQPKPVQVFSDNIADRISNSIWMRVKRSPQIPDHPLLMVRELVELREAISKYPTWKRLNILAVAEYRMGNLEEAVDAAIKSVELVPAKNALPNPHPVSLSILALSQSRLGNAKKADEYRKTLDEIMQQQSFANDPECQAFLAEVNKLFEAK